MEDRGVEVFPLVTEYAVLLCCVIIRINILPTRYVSANATARNEEKSKFLRSSSVASSNVFDSLAKKIQSRRIATARSNEYRETEIIRHM